MGQTGSPNAISISPFLLAGLILSTPEPTRHHSPFQIRGRKLQRKPVTLGCHAGCAVITSTRQCPPLALTVQPAFSPTPPRKSPTIVSFHQRVHQEETMASSPQPSTRAKCVGSATGRAVVVASQHCFIIIFHTRASPRPGPSPPQASRFYC